MPKKIVSIDYKVISTEIIGKIHGQQSNSKPIGYIIVSDGEISGISEVYLSTYFSVYANSIFNFFNDKFAGEICDDILRRINNFSIPFVSRNGIFTSCLGCFENALLDLAAKQKGLPLYEFLNSENLDHAFKYYASGGSVIMSSEEIIDEIGIISAQNFDGYKIRIGLKSWDEDMERVDAASRYNGYVMVDGICGTRNPPYNLQEALSVSEYLIEKEIYWFEEPLHPDNYAEMKILQENSSINIAAGEAYSGIGEFQNFINFAKTNYVQFDACHSGGISSCREINKLSKDRHKRTAIHVWGSAIAKLTNYHLALSLDQLDFFEIPLIRLGIDEAFDCVIDSKDDLQKFIDKPGIGIDIEIENLHEIEFEPGSEYSWK